MGLHNPISSNDGLEHSILGPVIHKIHSCIYIIKQFSRLTFATVRIDTVPTMIHYRQWRKRAWNRHVGESVWETMSILTTDSTMGLKNVIFDIKLI